VGRGRGNYAPGKDLKAGTVGYFPEGTFYGPQSDTSKSAALLLQMGGSAGYGFMSYQQLNRGYEKRSDLGKFDGGVFTRSTTDGRAIAWRGENGASASLAPTPSHAGRLNGMAILSMATGNPTPDGRTHGWSVTATPRAEDNDAEREQRLQIGEAFFRRLIEEDEPIMKTIRFHDGLLIDADRALARFLQYVRRFQPRDPPGNNSPKEDRFAQPAWAFCPLSM